MENTMFQNPILEGFLFGLATVIFIGPVLFTLVNASIQHGFWGGFSVAGGIIVSDIIAAGICYFGFYQLFKTYVSEFWLGVGGVIILSFLALRFILAPPSSSKEERQKSIKNLASGFSYGFLVNFVNPFVFAVWFGIVAYSSRKYEEDASLFVVSMLIGIFSLDITRAYLAHYLKGFLKPRYLKKIFRIFGLILIGFVIRIIYFLYQL